MQHIPIVEQQSSHCDDRDHDYGRDRGHDRGHDRDHDRENDHDHDCRENDHVNLKKNYFKSKCSEIRTQEMRHDMHDTVSEHDRYA